MYIVVAVIDVKCNRRARNCLCEECSTGGLTLHLIEWQFFCCLCCYRCFKAVRTVIYRGSAESQETDRRPLCTCRKSTVNTCTAPLSIGNRKLNSKRILSAIWLCKTLQPISLKHFSFYFPAKIGFFYSVFYGVLAALVAVCMLVFLRTLDPRIPKWQLHESIIGTNPGKSSLTCVHNSLPSIRGRCLRFNLDLITTCWDQFYRSIALLTSRLRFSSTPPRG